MPPFTDTYNSLTMALRVPTHFASDEVGRTAGLRSSVALDVVSQSTPSAMRLAIAASLPESMGDATSIIVEHSEPGMFVHVEIGRYAHGLSPDSDGAGRAAYGVARRDSLISLYA
jgi:hypothetical protein